MTLKDYLNALRRSLFDGELFLCDYEHEVKSLLQDARKAGSIDYSQWSRLYYEYIG